MTLSLCMIVKDEAEALPTCLNSVRDYVDEMMVLDTGSQDQTVAIAKDLGAKVDTIDWPHDFAAARNQSLQRATGDWILVLDADETLTPAGQTVLTQVRMGQALGTLPLDAVVLITLLRHEVNASQTPYSAVSRLFRNRADIRFDRPYHETVDDSISALLETEPHWQVVAWPPVAIAHTGYQATAIAQRRKVDRARDTMAAYLQQHPDDAYICNKLGALYGDLGQWETGRSLLERGLASGQADAHTQYELHYHLGIAARATEALAEAATHYRAAIQQPIPDILKVGAYVNLGSLRQQQQDFLGAIDQFQKAVQAAPNFAIAHFNLGTAQRSRGYLLEAIVAYQQAIALNPAYAEAYQNLGVALFKLGKLPESRQAFQQAIALYRQTDPATAQRLQAGIQKLGL